MTKLGTARMKAADISFGGVHVDTIFVLESMTKEEVEDILWQYDILIYDNVTFRSI